MLENTAATEGEVDRKTMIGTTAPDHALRDAFEAIWRIAGLPAGDLGRNPDGTYKAARAMQAWDRYVETREWRAVLAAAKRAD